MPTILILVESFQFSDVITPLEMQEFRFFIFLGVFSPVFSQCTKIKTQQTTHSTVLLINKKKVLWGGSLSLQFYFIVSMIFDFGAAKCMSNLDK